MTKVRRALGAWGEDLAAGYLVAAGLVVVARNWRCRDGELDIIAREAETIVFCEVKTRRGTTFGPPSAAIVGTKARRLRVLAARWLAQNADPVIDVRFDVICIMTPRRGTPSIEHLRGVLG